MNQVLQNGAALLLASAMAGTLAACGGGADPLPVDPVPVGGQAADPVPLDVARIGVLPSNGTVAIPGAAIAIAADGSLQFNVEMLPLGASNAVTWTVSGPACAAAACGTVDAGGRYVAPAAPPGSPITLTATSVTTPAQAATALISVGPQSAGVFAAAANMIAARSG